MRGLLRRRHLGLWIFIAAGLVAILVLVIVSPWASKSPDGLEKVARDRGFAGNARAGSAPIKDYKVPGVSGSATSTRISGLIGVAVTFVMALGIGMAALSLSRRRARNEGRPESTTG